MISVLRRRTKTTTNPVFYEDELALLLADEPERRERLRTEHANADLLTWNVFASLETHSDNAWLAYRLQTLGGPDLRAPLRLSLWTGRLRGSIMRPNPRYLAWVSERVQTAGGSAGDLQAFREPVEVPVRIETPDVLLLVDTVLAAAPRGNGGRDRLAEVIDGGADHARRIGKTLAVAVVYPSGSSVGAELSARVNRLRDPTALAEALPHRHEPPAVVLREVSWQQLLRLWDAERGYLRLGGQPVRAFLEHVRELGLH